MSMNAKFVNPSAAGNAVAVPRGPSGMAAGLIEDPGGSVGYACCCPARPVVRVIMPQGPSRPHSTDLLLCAHHYRVSRAALATARAVVGELPDTPEDIVSWIGIGQGSARVL
jgi:hypothetical protein